MVQDRGIRSNSGKVSSGRMNQVPIKAGNELIGGVGVSGAPGGDKDEACANSGLAKVADALK